MKNKNPNTIVKSTNENYEKFNVLDGSHPLKQVLPEGYVEYKARRRHGGRVAFFNFDLAKSIGLISMHHSNVLTDVLKQKILDTFSIIIINEYDQENNTPIPPEDILSGSYMATRYLQLQHPCKRGTTSGDGRSVWNGMITHNGMMYDISSCGTGATKLSPATNINKKFYQSGDPTISYGCGYAEKDEGVAALFFSEVLKQNEFKTEQLLGIIEFENNLSINIRVAPCLLRPSHFFCHLKQSNLDALTRLTQYYMTRQEYNSQWPDMPKKMNARYDYFLSKITETFAQMSARFEDDYIFCWLDWDGDNILMDGGIIDYGSVRQFGLFHHEYRYDDVQRFSTTITEQKNKAKYIVQVFAQLVDYLKTGTKKNIKSFSHHPSMLKFEQLFAKSKKLNLLHKMGFTKEEARYLSLFHTKKVECFQKIFSEFERTKSSKGVRKVADGITWDAVFCMRDILRELPQVLLVKDEFLKTSDFIEIMKSNYANSKDIQLALKAEKSILLFQTYYKELVLASVKHFKRTYKDQLLDISTRSSVINKFDRVTGDSITTITAKVMHMRPKLLPEELMDLVHQFSGLQNFIPGQEKVLEQKNSRQKRYIGTMLKIVREFSEGV